jgi:hypothetical protein
MCNRKSIIKKNNSKNKGVANSAQGVTQRCVSLQTLKCEKVRMDFSHAMYTYANKNSLQT